MPDQNEGRLSEGGENDTLEQTPPPILPPPIGGPENAGGDDGGSDRDKVKKNHLRARHWRRYVGTFCQVALVFITFYYTKAAYRQAKASETAAKAARDAVKVASQTLCETQRSNARQEKLTDAARVSAQKAAQDSLNATAAEFDQAQRPWVGIQGFECIDCTSMMGKPTSSAGTNSMLQTLRISKFVGTIINTGKTPAVGMEINAIATAMPASRGVPTWRSLRAYFKSSLIDSKTIVVLPPNVTHQLTFIDGAEYGREWFVGPSEKRTVYVVGEVRYYGSSRKKLHTTTFCLMNVDWLPESGFKYCPTGNDMN